MGTATKTCSRCGEAIPPGALGGNCPKCLVALALSSGETRAADEDVRGPGPQRFFGDYEIVGELARGGMGVVYRARQVSLNRPVALKMIATGQLATPSQLQRFRQEAEAAARLDHSNIVPIYEVGEHQRQHFYSMKLIEGGTLDGALPRTRRDAALLVDRIARAVHYAHQRGVLHRDLKPTNILIDGEGQPHVTDFGLAKLFEEGSSLTQSMAVLGTPAYMAPELALGKSAQATTAADVYSLGAILYELLAGQPPFVAENVPALLRKIVEEEPEPPSKVERRSESTSTVPRDLEIICLKCLEKNPADRYTSARSLAEDLEHWLAGEPVIGRPAGTMEKFFRWCRRKPALAGLWGALVLIFFAGLSGILWQWGRAEASARDALRASAQAREDLWRSQLAQAHAQRLSGVAGRKESSLAAVKAAAKIRPSPELRDEAIAALALCDVSESASRRTRVSAHEQAIFDPELERYAIGGARGDVSIFRMDTGEKILELQGPANSASKLRFSPNGQLLAAHFANGEVMVWNLTNSASILKCRLGGGLRNSMLLDFSPDQRTLAMADGKSGVRLFDLAGGTETSRLPIEGDSSRINFRPDGKVLGVSVSTNLVLWSLADNRPTLLLPHVGEPTWFAWHPDCRRLVSACDDSLDVWLWDTSRTNRVNLKGHLELLSRVSFNRRGDILMSAAYDGSTRFWNAESGEMLFISRAGFGWQFSKDDSHIGYMRENQGLGVWKFNPSTIYREIHLPMGASRRVSGFDFAPDGRFLVAANPEGIHLYDPGSGAPLAHASHRNHHSVWFTSDGDRVVLVGGDHLHAWKLAQNGDEVQLQDNDRFEFQPRTGLDAGSMTRGVQHLLTVPANDQVFCVDLGAPGSGWVLQGRGLIGSINSAAISSDTNWIATSYWKDRGTHIWDTRTRQHAHSFGASGGFVTFSPDNRRLLVGSARGYASWEIGTWRRVWELSRSTAGELPGSGAFSPDGRMIALCPEVNLLQLVEAETGRKIATLHAPVPKNIGMVAFSPDGRTLAAATFDTEIQLWDLHALRQELAKLNLDWQ